jgi:hypothetical protein
MLACVAGAKILATILALEPSNLLGKAVNSYRLKLRLPCANPNKAM